MKLNTRHLALIAVAASMTVPAGALARPGDVPGGNPSPNAQTTCGTDYSKNSATGEYCVDPATGVRRITKLMDPAEATGEYIGLTIINPHAADDLASALQATFERDPQLYYEDGYQEMVNRGQRVDVQPIGEVSWVEIDNHDDLAKGREIACQY